MKIVAALILVLGTAAGGTAANGQPCPSAELIDCTPIQKCEPTQDDRDCNRCLVKLLGRCQLRANDPACETAKVSQNAAYDIERAKCEADKTVRKAKCEATKAAVVRAAAECAKQK
jgi:hypothetical protein